MRLTEFIESTKDFKTILTTIRDQKNQLITGVAGSAATLLLAALHEKLTQPQLRALTQSGLVSIQSHGWSHKNMAAMGWPELVCELLRSKLGG